MEFKWSSNFNLPDSKINDQHKHLFNLCNKFFEIHQYGDDKNHLKKIVKELYEYAQIHFKDEENYMASIQYPSLEEHKQKHEMIIEEMNQVLTSSHSFEELGDQLYPFLKKWILEHVRNEDLKLREFFTNNERSNQSVSPQQSETDQ